MNDFKIITDNQKKVWSSGDFNQIARLNWEMSERLVSEVDPKPRQRVLDVACGSGTAALVAERRFCEVTGLDYVPSLIDRARLRAEANGQKIEFIVGDAQKMPFPDGYFDCILSVYGVQFAPDQEKAAAELVRVCKPGGIIGLAGPAPEGWSKDFFAAHANYNPPPPGIHSPLRWGTEQGLKELFGDSATSIVTKKRTAQQYYRSIDHAVEIFSTWFGPTLTTLEKIEGDQKVNLLNDLREVFERYNTATDGTAIAENIYLQIIIQV
ncbi:MAG: class I SAM-dependent methyltransferase [Balneolaceae bacterium]|nr:class I SAM-dependent methyltransferase [Balneolaceae bacterium]